MINKSTGISHSVFSHQTINNISGSTSNLFLNLHFCAKVITTDVMRILWILCVALIFLAVFGDLVDAKKYKGSSKKVKDVKSTDKFDNSVKHNKEKYHQDKQKFVGKRDKRDTRHTDSSNIVEEAKSIKPKRKCSNPEKCSKSSPEIPNKKQKVEPKVEFQKPLKGNKNYKEKSFKTKTEKHAKNHKNKKTEEIVVEEREEQMQEKPKSKHDKIVVDESVVENKKSKKHKKVKRSVEENQLLEEPAVDEIEDEDAQVEDEGTTCPKTKIENEPEVENEDQEVDEDSILERL